MSDKPQTIEITYDALEKLPFLRRIVDSRLREILTIALQIEEDKYVEEVLNGSSLNNDR